MADELDITLLSKPRAVTITTDRKTPSATLQEVWDGETSENKQTFVNDNDTDIVPLVGEESITVTKLDDVTEDIPINTAYASGIDAGDHLGSPTWDQMATLLGRGYHVPMPTGQVTSKRDWDDAYVEANVFTNRDQGTKIFNSLSDFFTLNHNNEFGNTLRFTDKNGNAATLPFGDNTPQYVVDNHTSLGFYFPSDIATGRTWPQAIDDAAALDVEGFDDYFIPNLKQVKTLAIKGDGSTTYYLFDRTIRTTTSHVWWTSTWQNLTYYWGIRNSLTVVCARYLDSATNRRFYCRKHF